MQMDKSNETILLMNQINNWVNTFNKSFKKTELLMWISLMNHTITSVVWFTNKQVLWVISLNESLKNSQNKNSQWFIQKYFKSII